MTSDWNQNTILEVLKKSGQTGLLGIGKHGLERETLRTNSDGTLALSPHPKDLSDPLTDPHITTDFSESQMELVTAPFSSIDQALESLTEIHRQTIAGLENGEQLWPASMPCILPDPSLIPIARFGTGPEAAKRETYRRGLALRYGAYVQMLCGVHYNLSFSEDLWEHLHDQFGAEQSLADFKNQRAMGLVRNFIRQRWLLVYLLGATPKRHASFRCSKMAQFPPENAIALRLSRCGYHNPAEVKIDYNDFTDHLASVEAAMATPHPPYRALGLEKEGVPQQLNDHLLQLANEYYFPIRMKPAFHPDSFLTGLKETGVSYFELRILDVDPHEPTGVNPRGLRLSHVFLLHCLLSESPLLTPAAYRDTEKDQEQVAVYGQAGLPGPLQRAGHKLLSELQDIARFMGADYEEDLAFFMAEFSAPKNLPWKKILTEMEQDQSDFIEYNLAKSQQHQTFLKS